MQQLPSSTRSISYSASSGQTGDITETSWGEDYSQSLDSRDIINLANTVPLIRIFKHYNIHLDLYNKKTTCPFKSHKGGRERTPSFYFYPDTNSYYCWGCKIGNHAVDFVAEMDHCTKERAASKILALFESEVDEDRLYDGDNSSERLEIMMDFSNAVREFYQTHSTEEARTYIEAACQRYDGLNLEHDLDNEALQRVVEELKEYIGAYKT